MPKGTSRTHLTQNGWVLQFDWGCHCTKNRLLNLNSTRWIWMVLNLALDMYIIGARSLSSVRFIACPSAWTIRVSFFYVPENYPNTIREKKQSPWTIQILSQNFWQNLVKKTNNWNYPRKKTNTLNYPNTIRFFLDSSNTLVFFLIFFLNSFLFLILMKKVLPRFIRAWTFLVVSAVLDAK